MKSSYEKNKASLEKLDAEIDKQIKKTLDKTVQKQITSVTLTQETNEKQLSNYLDVIRASQGAFTKFLESSSGKAVSESLATAANFASTLADAQDESTKEGFERAKKFKIAEVVTSAIQASFQAFGAAQQFGPILGPILGAAQVAAIAISSNKAIQDIQNSKFGSSDVPSTSTGGGGAAGLASGAGGAPISGAFLPGGFLSPGATTPPSTTSAGPVRAYVVTGDVANGLEAENQINRRRALGPG